MIKKKHILPFMLVCSFVGILVILAGGYSLSANYHKESTRQFSGKDIEEKTNLELNLSLNKRKIVDEKTH